MRLEALALFVILLEVLEALALLVVLLEVLEPA
jgi:hypothetical protein